MIYYFVGHEDKANGCICNNLLKKYNLCM
jgi:hypothetical protein